MTIKKKHVHQYYKSYPYGKAVGPLGRIRVQWACALPDCNHILPSNMPEPYGKMSLCNGCMEVFVLDLENMNQDKPMCDRCANPDRTIFDDSDVNETIAAKIRIHKSTGKTMEEITDDEIDRMKRFMRLENM